MIELRRAVPEDLDCLFEAANSAFAGEHRIGERPPVEAQQGVPWGLPGRAGVLVHSAGRQDSGRTAPVPTA